MKKVIVVMLIVSFALSSILMSGCGSKGVSKSETNYYYVDEGKKVYLTEHHSDVAAVRKMAKQFADALNDRDYNSITGKEEYDFYTKDLIDKLLKDEDDKKTVKVYKDYQIVSKYEDCRFEKISFDNDFTQGEVIYWVKARITSANNQYFRDVNKNVTGGTLAKDLPFEQQNLLKIEKVDGTWKVGSLEFGKEFRIVK